jgi:hypothetical protein
MHQALVVPLETNAADQKLAFIKFFLSRMPPRTNEDTIAAAAYTAPPIPAY